jgi:hypothetical protein
MKAIFAFGLLVLIAFFGSRFLFKKKRLFLPLSYFFLSGLIYVFLGLSLGKSGLNVLSPAVLEGLKPLISLGLGWVGFIFGFQLEYKYLRRFPQKYVELSFLQSLVVICLVVAALGWLLRFLFSSEPFSLLYGLAVALGLLLSLNSPSLLNFASAEIPQKGNYYYLARFLVSVSGFWGIAGLALVASFWHFPFLESSVFIKGVVFLLCSTIFSIFIGYIFHFLTIRKTSERELLVYLLGLVFFTSGTAGYFNLPSLYICMVLGITFSNLTRIQEKLYPLILSTEKPFYIIFLILVGALWEFNLDYKIVLLAVILLILRVVGYSFPLRPLGKILRFPFPLPGVFGFCFLSSGGIAVAFIVSLKLIYPVPLIDVFVSVALMATVLGEILSPWGLKNSILKLDRGK